MSARTAKSGYFFSERQELELRYTYRPEFVPLLLDYLGAKAGMSMLELGCGSGFLSRLLAQSVPEVQVIGLDSDSASLEIARTIQEYEGIGETLRFEQGDAQQLPFPDASFDFVTSHRLL
ncbi:MAG: class I SAM-dependent methyltransferase [Chloroflexota bacterium]